MSDFTRILAAIERGDQKASADLLPLVYAELRRLAQRHMGGERSDHTLQATALVHEAYLRLVGSGATHWDGKAHFFSAAAEAMRRILIDHARRHNSVRQGRGVLKVGVHEDIVDLTASPTLGDNVVELSNALDRLAKEFPTKAEVVKLRYFAGLSLAEAGEILGISRATAHRHWLFARAWLYDAMTKTDRH